MSNDNYLKEMIEQSKFITAYRNNLKLIQNELENNDRHVKGYMFDSLVYRFKDYQARAFQSEVNDYKYKNRCSEMTAREIITSRHNRDLIRFIEILDEAIGEHD